MCSQHRALVVLVALLVALFSGCGDAERHASSDVCVDCADVARDASGDCAGIRCDDVAPECVGAGRCDADRFVACVGGAEAEPEDCSLLGAGAFCASDGCVAQCTEGQVVCNGGAAGHPYACQAGALVQLATCAAAQHCVDGTCTADVCAQGTTFCEGGHPTRCDDAGSASTQMATCGADQTCVGGACETDVVPSPARCAEVSAAILAATGPTVTVSPGPPGFVQLGGNTTTLRAVVSDAAEGTTVLLEDGVYTFEEASGGSYTGIYVTKPGITIRSASGDADAVVLDSVYVSHGNGSAPVTIAASGVTLADLTIERSIYHLVHIWNGGDDVLLHNLRLIDGGQQFVKTSPGTGNRITGGHVSCSVFRMTEAGRRNVWGYGPADGGTRCYTGGIDTHETDDWVVSDNRFEGLYCDATEPHPAHGKDRDGVEQATYVGGLAEHAIHMWDGGPGTTHVIERNVIVDCARGIGLGLGASLRVHGAVVRNNMVFSSHAASGEHDVGIIFEGSQGVRAWNNTVFFSHPDAYPNAIEYRFDTTTGAEISNNLTNKLLRQRDGAQATLSNNYTEAQAAWFVDPVGGDLHLAACGLVEVDGAGVASSDVVVDIDGETRGSAPDLGADECAP